MVYDGKSGRVHPTASHTSPIATEWSAACITDEVTGKAAEGFKPRVKNLNLIGPKVRRLRHQRSDLTPEMGHIKTEVRMVLVG
jgi:hypothetical protein